MNKKEELIKHIFETVYNWGKAGIVINENCDTFQRNMKELQELNQPQECEHQWQGKRYCRKCDVLELSGKVIANQLDQPQEGTTKEVETIIVEEVQKYTKEIVRNYASDNSTDIIKVAQNLSENLLISRLIELIIQPQEQIVNKCKKECCNNATLDNILHKVKSGKNSWAGKCKECGEILVFTERNELPQEEIEEIKSPFDIDVTSWSQVSAMLTQKSNEHTRIINQYLLGKTFYPDNNNAEEQDVESIIESETTEEDYQFTEKGFGPNKK